MKLPAIFYWSFGGVSVLLLTIAALIFYNNQKAANQFIRIEGTVLRNEFNGTTARPIILYSWEGKELEYAGTTYTNPPAFDPGEKIEMFVNPNDSSDVLINSFSERWLAMTIVGGIGLVFLGFLTLFHFLSGKSLLHDR